MTEESKTQFRTEGEPAFPADKENDNSSSSSEEKTEAETTQSDEGNNTQTDEDKLPFHKHPRWLEREDSWSKRYNDQEQRHQEDIRKMREEFGNQKKDITEKDSIPSWFGGTQEQWDEYNKHENQKLAEAEERALNRITEARNAEEKAVKEATDYMHAEIEKIESDKTLNPTGDKVDLNKLVKFVIDNDLVDSKQRWNYKAGYMILKSQTTTPNNKDRKTIAGATVSESKAETKPTSYKTSADFKKNRPW